MNKKIASIYFRIMVVYTITLRLAKNKSMPGKAIHAKRSLGFLSGIPISAWQLTRISLPNKQPIEMVPAIGKKRGGISLRL
jgi:hypothetical protein